MLEGPDFRQGQRGQVCALPGCRKVLGLREPRVEIILRDGSYSYSSGSKKIGVYHAACFHGLTEGRTVAVDPRFIH